MKTRGFQNDIQLPFTTSLKGNLFWARLIVTGSAFDSRVAYTSSK